MHLWQGYHSSNAVLISLHPFRWHSVLKHSITDDVLINHLIKVMSASHFHCEVFGRGWSILRKFLPYQNVNLHSYLLYQYGLSASYITPIIMYHNPWLSFILMFTLSLIWPWEPLQASFYVTLTCPHHSLGTFLFSGVRCSNAHLLLFLLQPGISDFFHEPLF